MYFLVFVAGVNVLLKQQQKTFSTWFGFPYRNMIDFCTQVLYLPSFLLIVYRFSILTLTIISSANMGNFVCSFLILHSRFFLSY